MATNYRIGMDATEIDVSKRRSPIWGQFLRRIFTDGEIAYATRRRDRSAFAGVRRKEAAMRPRTATRRACYGVNRGGAPGGPPTRFHGRRRRWRC